MQILAAVYYVVALLFLPWWGLFLALPILLLSPWGTVLALAGSIFMDTAFGSDAGFFSLGYTYVLITCIGILVTRLLRNRLLD